MKRLRVDFLLHRRDHDKLPRRSRWDNGWSGHKKCLKHVLWCGMVVGGGVGGERCTPSVVWVDNTGG